MRLKNKSKLKREPKRARQTANNFHSRPWMNDKLENIYAPQRLNYSYEEYIKKIEINKELPEILNRVKGYYLENQNYEKVEIQDNISGPKRQLKFNVYQKDGKNLSLFKIAFTPNSVTPVEIVTVEEDLEYDDITKLEHDLRSIVENRVQLLNEFYQ